MTTSMARHLDILVVRVSGFHTPEPVDAVVGAVHDELIRQGLTRLLLDLRALVGLVTSSDHIGDAHIMVERLKGMRWATLVRRNQYSGAGRAYCIAQGCDMETFFDEAAALAWLQADRAPDPG